jgi:hypothetical protein
VLYSYCAKKGSAHVWYLCGGYKLSLCNVSTECCLAMGYDTGILLFRGSANIACTQINTAFAGRWQDLQQPKSWVF